MAKKTSPYRKTKIKDYYLDVWSPLFIEAQETDPLVTISAEHHLRPDLLAYELYGSPNLYWVFARRNMDVLIDPVNDFTAGTQIYVPDPESVGKLLT